jgi:hypothetical protein
MQQIGFTESLLKNAESPVKLVLMEFLKDTVAIYADYFHCDRFTYYLDPEFKGIQLRVEFQEVTCLQSGKKYMHSLAIQPIENHFNLRLGECLAELICDEMAPLPYFRGDERASREELEEYQGWPSRSLIAMRSNFTMLTERGRTLRIELNKHVKRAQSQR